MPTPLNDALQNAMQLHQARRLPEAEAAYRQIVHDYPNHAFAIHLLGVVQMQAGQLDEAIAHLERAMEIGNPPIEFYRPLIDATAAAGRIDRALLWQKKALATGIGWADGYARLADFLLHLGRLEEACEALKRAIALAPSDPVGCRNNLGVIYDRLRRYDDAVAVYRSALAIKPNDAMVHRNLGDALRMKGNLPAAEASYREAVRCDPSLAEAFNGIGLTLYLRGRFTEAIEQFDRALALDPASANACMNLALCHGRLGDPESRLVTLRRTLELSPPDPKLHSTLTMMMNYTQGGDPPAVLNESLEFNRRYAVSLMPNSDLRGSEDLTHGLEALEARVTTGGPVRIGFVSGDFRHHPVAIFLEPLLRHLDRERFTVACYSDVGSPDAFTARFKSLADLWRDVAGTSDTQLAGQIRADQIDILIDLAGHTADNRLLVFARRPAPIQVSWLGYPNTTGLPAIDYRLTDAWADPVGVDRFYTEKLVRLPDAFFVYQPPEQDEPVSRLPMLDNGFVTFGSFNNITKITPRIARLWTEILRLTPGSRLLIAGIPADAMNRIRSMLAGISADRIEFPQANVFEDFLKLHHRVDLALDAFPYTGHTTTCNCLWMGVPVVSLAGPTAVSRCGVSILANLALAEDWVVNSDQDYVRTAVDWAGRTDDLSRLRAGLRERFRPSVLTDGPGFARKFEISLLSMSSR